MRKRVAVIMGGPSAEFEVSLKTGEGILNNLDKQKFSPLKILIDKKQNWWVENNFYSLEKVVKLLKSVDFVFLALHGRFGEDGRIQGFLETIGVPYSGSAVLASALAMDKHKTLCLLAKHQIFTPRHHFFNSSNVIDINKITLPCVVLPNDSGSSVGVSICNRIEELKKAIEIASQESTAIIISEYLRGVEITVPILGSSTLPPIEIIPKKSSFYDYQSKYADGGSDHIIPARLPQRVLKKALKNALLSHQIIGCRGYSRVDMIISKNIPYILEINTLPGMTPTSLLPQSAEAAGISYPQLLELMMKYSLS